MEHAGDKLPGDSLFTHCHRELFHAQWKDLLYGEFLRAYEHGMVFVCGDNVKRRIFPRIFTYSADYPEKYVHFISSKSPIEKIVTVGFSSLIFVTSVNVRVRDALFRR